MKNTLKFSKNLQPKRSLNARLGHSKAGKFNIFPDVGDGLSPPGGAPRTPGGAKKDHARPLILVNCFCGFMLKNRVQKTQVERLNLDYWRE